MSQEVQRDIRQRLGVGVLTKLRPDMNLIDPFEAGPVAVCPQGQRLNWLGLEESDQLHGFGVTDPNPLCGQCWEQSKCARQFSYEPATHEILFGRIPLADLGNVPAGRCGCAPESTRDYDPTTSSLTVL